MVANRRRHHGIKILLKKNGETVMSYDMAAVDQRFIDEDEIVKNAMRYIAMRQEYNRRVDDNAAPEWDTGEIVVNPHLSIPIGRFGRLAN